MLHRFALAGLGIAFICGASVAGCFTSGQSGDPGAGFLGGAGPHYGGAAGTYGSGAAGARSTGGVDAGEAGATGEGGSICGGGAGSTDGGSTTDGATSASDGGTHAGDAAPADGATEAGATEGGSSEGGGAAPACTIGAIFLTWTLEQAGTTITETCAQAGVATIRLVANGMNVDFKCAEGAGRTPALAAGTYAVSLHALDAKGAAVSDTSTMNVTVGAGQIVSLGDAVFDVD